MALDLAGGRPRWPRRSGVPAFGRTHLPCGAVPVCGDGRGAGRCPTAHIAGRFGPARFQWHALKGPGRLLRRRDSESVAFWARLTVWTEMARLGFGARAWRG